MLFNVTNWNSAILLNECNFKKLQCKNLILLCISDTLREILRELDNKLTEEDIGNIIEEVDEDGSGTLDFDGKVNNQTFFQEK